MNYYYHRASSLSFWLQMLTAANAVPATVVSSNWFGVKVSYLKDLVMISGGTCCGPMALICFLEWPAKLWTPNNLFLNEFRKQAAFKI